MLTRQLSLPREIRVQDAGQIQLIPLGEAAAGPVPFFSLNLRHASWRISTSVTLGSPLRRDGLSSRTSSSRTSSPRTRRHSWHFRAAQCGGMRRGQVHRQDRAAGPRAHRHWPGGAVGPVGACVVVNAVTQRQPCVRGIWLVPDTSTSLSPKPRTNTPARERT